MVDDDDENGRIRFREPKSVEASLTADNTNGIPISGCPDSIPLGIGAIAWAPLRIKRDKCDIYLRGKIKGKGKSEKVTVVVVVAVVCNIFTVHVAPGVTVEAILRCCSNSSESDSTKKHLGRKRERENKSRCFSTWYYNTFRQTRGVCGLRKCHGWCERAGRFQELLFFLKRVGAIYMSGGGRLLFDEEIIIT